MGQKEPGTCIFCGATGMSKEHIWSNWMKALLPPATGHRQFGHVVKGDETGSIIVPSASKRQQGPFTQRKIRKVCETCNNGWMSGAVDNAKRYADPLIRGESVEITREAQQALAMWISIATVMGEYTDEKTRVIPAEERAWLKDTGYPPQTWSIYIGRYQNTIRAPVDYRHNGIIRGESAPSISPGVTREFVHVTTYMLGALVVHVFGSTDSAFAAALRLGYPAKGILRIWPVERETVMWSTLPILGDTEVDTIANLIPEMANQAAALRFGAPRVPRKPHD